MGAFTVPSSSLSGKIMTGDVVFCFLEMALLRGVNNFKPHPKSMILVHLRGSFLNFQQAMPSFLCGSPPPPRFLRQLEKKLDISQ